MTLHGVFVRASGKQGHFDVVTGKPVLAFRRDAPENADEPSGQRFAFGQIFDEKPKRRLFDLLKSQGMQDNQQITSLTDGGDDVRNLPL